MREVYELRNLPRPPAQGLAPLSYKWLTLNTYSGMMQSREQQTPGDSQVRPHSSIHVWFLLSISDVLRIGIWGFFLLTFYFRLKRVSYMILKMQIQVISCKEGENMIYALQINRR